MKTISNLFFNFINSSNWSFALFIISLILFCRFAFKKNLLAISEVFLFLSNAVRKELLLIAKAIVKALNPVKVPTSKTLEGL